MKILFLNFSFFIMSLTSAQIYKTNEPLAHTYSIVCRDEKTGEMGVAVQSHWFSVGTAVSWAEAGAGAVATQSFVNKSFGILGLNLLRTGLTAQQVVDSLLKDDEGREVRQLLLTAKEMLQRIPVKIVLIMPIIFKVKIFLCNPI